MATVTVPGPDHTIISFPNTFTNSQNLFVAQAIANFLGSLPLLDPPGDPSLNVAVYSNAPPTTPAAIAGDVNELVVPTSLSGGTVSVPAGYNWVADGTGGGAFTVLGAQNFIGGNGALNVSNTTVPAASGIDSIAAGNGADLFNLMAGSTYYAAAGNGADTFYGNGSGTMAGGTGSNLFFADAAGGNNLVLSYGGHDTIVAGAGAATVATYGSGPLIFGGSGNLTVFSNSATSSTIVGGTGSETVFGGISSNEVVFGNSSSLTFIANTDDSSTIVGGSSPSTLFGSAGSAITYFSTASTGGALYAAGTGNETLNAAGSTANNTIFGGADSTAGNSLVGGSGSDTFTGGTGSDTMVGGSGSNNFFFTDGAAGGNDFIVGYTSSDVVGLFGYGSGAATAALAAATVAGGSTTIALSDNTKITFENVSTPSSIKIFST
jgi:Ca2+-binding RTX toxin-like protein